MAYMLQCTWQVTLVSLSCVANPLQTTLRDQGTPEQHKLFLEPAEAYKAIGCYAQTELGHGSNVRGLETTATWNPEDKTFILHSPHLTAS
jgi:acyl-CoA oxidase